MESVDMLGDKMSALYEYVQRKEQKGIENGKKIIIKKLYGRGMSIKEISKITEIDIGEVKRFVN